MSSTLLSLTAIVVTAVAAEGLLTATAVAASPLGLSRTCLLSTLPIDTTAVDGVDGLYRSNTTTTKPGNDVTSIVKDESTFIPPMYNKTMDEELFIERILEANFLFQDMLTTTNNIQNIKQDHGTSQSEKYGTRTRNNNNTNGLPLKEFATGHDDVTWLNQQTVQEHRNRRNPVLSQLIAAFERADYRNGTFLCVQGDTNADYLHIIFQGNCAVIMDPIGQLPLPYGILPPKSMFGELSLLFDSPRAASVQAITPVTVFRLDKDSFHYFLYNSCTNNITKEQLQQQVREIDTVIDQISGVKSKYSGNIIQPFTPLRSWLWRRWRGTILQDAWKAATLNMLLGIVFMACIRRWVHATWEIGMIPDPTNPFLKRMAGLSKLWHYQMNITTFILTFFLSQAYSLWRDVYTAGRQIQGRLNDVSMLLATTAERQPVPSSTCDYENNDVVQNEFMTPSTEYTPRASKFLEDIAVYTRLYHSLSWASLTKKYDILLTPRGLSRMLNRGVMTRAQYNVLVSVPADVCPPHLSCLMWILSRCLQALDEGILPNHESIRAMLIDRLLALRGVQSGVAGKLKGRIPLAYAHFVQILVDVFLVLAPFSLFTELGIWSVPAVGLLTLFYSGLLDLSKILLDPLDNDADFYPTSSVNMDIGVLIRESNAGSIRWKMGLESLPF